VLEHLDPDAATRLLADCHRVLKPGGILRIVVPDLETIARLYLKSLVDASAGHSDAAFRYEWMMLELYDQTVRAVPGGRMARYIAEGRAQEETRFIRNRIGDEALEPEADARPLGDAPPWWRAMRRTRAITSTLRTITAEAFAFVFLGPRGVAALREGLFRASGEVHRWMYDRFSLQRALEQAGFREVHVCAADESGIPQFARYGLESRAGQPRKPDSLYVEGHKSEAS
jgi:SAM-dependent methyltransferase